MAAEFGEVRGDGRAGVPHLPTTRDKARADDSDGPTLPAPISNTTQPESGHTIQGNKASGIEWETYKMLRSLGWDDEIRFQVSRFGGRSRFGGGQVLDFLVDAGPVPVVIDVRGQHWHGSTAGRSAQDRWREIRLQASRDAPRLVVVWEDVALSPDRLRALLLKELGAKR